jgi:hypothetical protein
MRASTHSCLSVSDSASKTRVRFLFPDEVLNWISNTQDLSCLEKGTISIDASLKKNVFKGTSPWRASSLLCKCRIQKENETNYLIICFGKEKKSEGIMQIST